jgi:hypothetical protein
MKIIRYVLAQIILLVIVVIYIGGPLYGTYYVVFKQPCQDFKKIFAVNWPNSSNGRDKIRPIIDQKLSRLNELSYSKPSGDSTQALLDACGSARSAGFGHEANLYDHWDSISYHCIVPF